MRWALDVAAVGSVVDRPQRSPANLGVARSVFCDVRGSRFRGRPTPVGRMTMARNIFLILSLATLVCTRAKLIVEKNGVEIPSATFTRFLGPDRYWFNETLTLYDGPMSDYCDAGPNKPLMGIIVFESQPSSITCSNPEMYINSAKAGATAIGWAAQNYAPAGLAINQWSWLYGRSNIDKSGMPYFDMVNLADDDDPEEMFSEPQRVTLMHNRTNVWMTMWTGGLYIFTVRMCPMIFAIYICFFMSQFAKELALKAQDRVKLTVLAVEAVTWVVIGTWAVLYGWGGASTWLSIEIAVVNASYISGTGFFTTLLMAMQLYETRNASKELRAMRPVFTAFRRRIAASFFVCVLLVDWGLIIGLMSYISVGALAILAGMVLVFGQIGIGVFFLVQGFSLAKFIKESAAGGSDATLAILKRMTRFLMICAGMMFLSVIVFLYFGSGVVIVPSGILPMLCLMIIGRAGGTWAKTMAVKPPVKKNTAKIAVTTDAASSTTVTANSTVVMSSNSGSINEP